MIKAVIFDCFGVLITGAPEVKNLPLLDYIIVLKTDYKIGLLSNVTSTGLHSRFSDDELTSHFDVVVTSGEVGFAKPDAQAFEITADRLGVKLDECVMIDDQPAFCEAAVRLGMQAIQYDSFDQMKHELRVLLSCTTD